MEAVKLILLFGLIIQNIQAAKILIFPFPYYSHIKELTHIGDELTKSGHELHLILPPTLPQIQQFRDIKMITLIEYKIKYKDFPSCFGETSDEIDEMLHDLITMTPIEDFRVNRKGFFEGCQNPLEDEELHARIKKENYDLAIIDSFPISRCHYILMYRFGIPYVSVQTLYEPWLIGTPALPSFVPFGLRGKPAYTDKMNFWERLSNTYALIDWTAFPGIHYLDDNLVGKYAPEMPLVTMDWLARRSMLWLFNTDIAIDYPRPTMPNEINIGGLSTKPAKPLPSDIKKFMDNSPEGVILASFGSLSVLSKNYLDIVIESFKQLKQKVIFRYVFDHPKGIPNHIKLLEWIPQNDILAHPNIKLFITHCGANSQFEALYNGVPMLNFPVFGDQPYNAKRADAKGYSRTIDFSKMTPEIIVDNINSIISNASYYDNIKRGSQIFRHSSMNPRQRAVYWIEYVLKYGGDHLHSHALDMPWYEYIMLDIIAFLIVILLILFLIFSFILHLTYKVCFKSKSPKMKVN